MRIIEKIDFDPKNEIADKSQKIFFSDQKKYVFHYFDQRATYLSFVKKQIRVPNEPVELRWKASIIIMDMKYKNDFH